MAPGGGAVNASLIGGFIADERGKWTCDLVEQRLSLRAVINIAADQL
jgi:hypothetical protein